MIGLVAESRSLVVPKLRLRVPYPSQTNSELDLTLAKARSSSFHR